MTSAPALPVLAVSGMMTEARIAGGHGIVTVVGGGDPARLARLLGDALGRGAQSVISFGIAGGLTPGHAPGTVVLADAVHDQGRRWPTDRAWTQRLSRLLPRARSGDVAGVDHMVDTPDGKRALHEATGAIAVDMESHIAARLAAQYGVPFAALRIVADPAHRTLPRAATVGMRPDGSMDAGAVMRALARRPGDIAALIHTAMDASAAFAALRASRLRLPGTLGFGLEAPADPAKSQPPAGFDASDIRPQSEVQVKNG